jgi:hypothetical protein
MSWHLQCLVTVYVGKPLVSVVGCSGNRIPVFPRVAIDQSCALIQGSRRHSNLELMAKHSSISHLQEGRVVSDEIPESKASLYSVLGKARASAARKHVNIGVTNSVHAVKKHELAFTARYTSSALYARRQIIGLCYGYSARR